MLERGTVAGDEIVQPVVAFDDLREEHARIAADPAAGIKLGIRY